MNNKYFFLKFIILLGYSIVFQQCTRTENRQSAITKIVVHDLNDSIKKCTYEGRLPKYSGKYFFSKFKFCQLEKKVGDAYLYVDGKMLPEYLRQGGDTTNLIERVVLCVGDSNNIIYYDCSDGSNFVLYTLK